MKKIILISLSIFIIVVVIFSLTGNSKKNNSEINLDDVLDIKLIVNVEFTAKYYNNEEIKTYILGNKEKTIINDSIKIINYDTNDTIIYNTKNRTGSIINFETKQLINKFRNKDFTYIKDELVNDIDCAYFKSNDKSVKLYVDKSKKVIIKIIGIENGEESNILSIYDIIYDNVKESDFEVPNDIIIE